VLSVRTRRTTSPPARVDLNALFRRFVTADSRSCASPVTTHSGLTGGTTNVRPRTSACSAPASAMLLRSDLTQTCLRSWCSAASRTSASLLATKSRNSTRLRPSTSPVLPLMATVPRFSTS
jgi:hypothetical protein